MKEIQEFSESENEWEDEPSRKRLKEDDEEEDEEEEEHEEEDEQEQDDEEGTSTKVKEKQPRVSKLEQRQLLEHRRAHKPTHSLVIKCKKLWEVIRVKKLEKPKREELMLQLMALVSGKCVDVIFKHDASRIIQCCLKYGNDQQRNLIALELKDHYVEVSKSQYGKFIISKILKFCRNYRSNVITSFYGHVRKLIRHKDAAVVIEECYSNYANAQQRTSLMQEFYGPEYILFKVHLNNLVKRPKITIRTINRKPNKTSQGSTSLETSNLLSPRKGRRNNRIPYNNPSRNTGLHETNHNI